MAALRTSSPCSSLGHLSDQPTNQSTNKNTPYTQVGTVAIANTIQSYLTLSYTKRVYLGPATSSISSPRQTPSSPAPSNSPATPLAGRLFGTWTFLQGLVRVYAAYNIDNPAFYQLAFGTYVIAWCHFTSEWFFYKTARWGEGLAGPVVVSNVSLVWMLMQWGFYVQ